ncbi:MAG: ABC transporter ATP-binding protein [Oscillospiraceae bacterium]|jgi:ABC-2 type transport system ATP-binding protein|nr:ABC transporter ATP-binding protein [Oscillospiraceae bacterium]
MIQAKNLNKIYKIKMKKHIWNRSEIQYKEAVHDISMDIEKGKIVGLLGVNGAGKTTTIKMLSTMISPSSGTIHVDDIDAVKFPFHAKKIINLITGGERNIYWRLSARENLEYFGSLYGLTKTELKKRIDYCLSIVNLTKNADIPVEKYSKGMKQRLQIARGLINNPSYIFLDEPTLGIDILMAKELREYIKRITVEENKGVLLTTHYIAEADELCNYIYVINNGKIVSEGTANDLKKLYTSNYCLNFIFDCYNKSLFDDIAKLENIIKIELNPELHSIKLISKENLIKKIIQLSSNYKCNINQIKTEDSLEASLMQILKVGNSHA